MVGMRRGWKNQENDCAILLSKLKCFFNKLRNVRNGIFAKFRYDDILWRS
jgi:hypothetical protein